MYRRTLQSPAHEQTSRDHSFVMERMKNGGRGITPPPLRARPTVPHALHCQWAIVRCLPIARPRCKRGYRRCKLPRYKGSGKPERRRCARTRRFAQKGFSGARVIFELTSSGPSIRVPGWDSPLTRTADREVLPKRASQPM
jgi:hypothetical protein